jgi:glutamyl-tRNA(Gln) amidotransferase subunit E
LKDIDFREIGLKVGLEVHQQLDTEHKLFCSCVTGLFKGTPHFAFTRRLRPTQSELGQIDRAALFEFQKGMEILYEANEQTACLVEMDEEPPHNLNSSALEITLIISLMLDSKPVDEIHVMRKTVIDGSNTTGFQRTCCVAFDGKIELDSKTVPIQHIGLEEDAARKMVQSGNSPNYRIDRLCIPLVEIATAPTIRTPAEAREVALAIGRILRATNRVKRGLGTIRQDLNISIQDGASVEIKGVQKLELVELVVKNEVRRQLSLLGIRDQLEQRRFEASNLVEEFENITEIFADTKCKVIHDSVKNGKQVFAVKLPKFKGLLRILLMPGVSLGTEMADRARFWGRCGGIFHTDELPAYGISTAEIKALKSALLANDLDAVVLVADTQENCDDALKAVCERAREAATAIPQETRAARLDGTTRYMRPRPGAARMYPETDVPSIRIPREHVETLRKNLPELPKQKIQRLRQNFGLNEKLAKQVLDSEFGHLFEKAVEESSASPKLVAVVLTETLLALKRGGVNIGKVSDQQLLEMFRLAAFGRVTREAIPDVIDWLSRHEGAKVVEAIESLGFSMLSEDELRRLVETLVEENRTLLMEHEGRGFGFFMGLVMKRVRGRANAELVGKIIREKLEDFHK